MPGTGNKKTMTAAEREALQARIRKLSTDNTETGCWEWTGSVHRTGYGRITLRGGHVLTVHRAAWMAWNSPVPVGLCVCHRCDNRLCVNPAHLFLGTHADNNHDMVAKGRNRLPVTPDEGGRMVGEDHPRAKLTAAGAVSALAAVRAGEAQRAVARRLGVSLSAVHSIVIGRTWSHATGIRAESR